MPEALMGGMASALANGLRATPGVDPHVQQSFTELLRELQGAAMTEAEAERRVVAWLAAAPPHAVTVLRSVVLAAASQKRVSTDSWLYRAFVARRGAPGPVNDPARQEGRRRRRP